MAFKLIVNDEEVFVTQKRVRSISLAGDVGFIADVPASVSTLKVTIKESDNLNTHLDDVRLLADRVVEVEQEEEEEAQPVITSETNPSEKNEPVVTENTDDNTNENDNVTSL